MDYRKQYFSRRKIPVETNRIRVAFVPLKSTFIGLPRALLFNMLFRDSFGGKIILRIDDTDELRAQPERLKTVFSTLHWLGINWDEGPDLGGPYAPYIQSERKTTYIDAATHLLSKKKAYRCFCNNSIGIKGCFGNCYNLSNDEVHANLEKHIPYCIRYKINNGEESYNDLVHGLIKKEHNNISDPVIVRTDGTPTFHLATAVDEGALNITHIIRGVDHLESAFVQRQIMNDLGTNLPQYLHFSIYESDGSNIYEDNLQGKYDVECLRKDGFLSEAIVNFLITSGYTPKGVDDCTLYKYQDFLNGFSLNNFSKSNQYYDFDRLISINRKWIRHFNDEEYIKHVSDYFDFCNYYSASEELLLVLKSHIDTFGDLTRKIDVLYDNSSETMRNIAIKLGDDKTVLHEIIDKLVLCEKWDQPSLKNVIELVSKNYSKKKCYETLRTAITYLEPFGSILEIVQVLGHDYVIDKLRNLLLY